MSFSAATADGLAAKDQRTGSEQIKRNKHPPRFENKYSGWLPRIPRVNHMTEMERVDHMANVGEQAFGTTARCVCARIDAAS